MTVKELMAQVDAEHLLYAFLLIDYAYGVENLETTLFEKLDSIPKLKKVLKENIRLFSECTPNDNAEPYTIFIMLTPSEDYKDQHKKELSAFAICDEDAFKAIDDKDFHIFGFDNAPIHDIAKFTVAKASLDKLGMEICAAKILSELFYWGILPEQREKNINELYERISKPIDKNELMKNSISLEELMKKHEEELVAGMSDDEKAYYHAQKRFEEETKEIVKRYQNRIISDNHRLYINAIKNEYKARRNTIEIVIDSPSLRQFKMSFNNTKNGKYSDIIDTFVKSDIETIYIDLEGRASYDIFTLLQPYWGNFNDCPDCINMKTKAKEWCERYAAVIINISHDTLMFKCNNIVNDKIISTIKSIMCAVGY